MRPSFKRFCFRSFVLLLLLVLGYFGWHFWQTRGWEKACGTYLVGGGETYITITGSKGWLDATGRINTTGMWDSTDKSLTASFENGRLVLNQKFVFDGDKKKRGPRSYMSTCASNVVLQPSSNTAGDWDIVKSKTVSEDGFSLKRIFFSILSSTFSSLDNFFKLQNWQEIIFIPIRILYEEKNVQTFSYAPPLPPQPSFLHRVDDPLIPAYFEKRYRNDLTTETLQMIRQMQERHPQDVYLALHRAEMEAVHGNPESAEQMWAQWTAQRDTFADPFLQITAKGVWKCLYMARFQQEHSEFAIPTQAPSNAGISMTGVPDGSYADNRAWLSALARINAPVFHVCPLVSVDRDVFEKNWYRGYINSLEPSKIALIDAYFGLLRGDARENWQVLKGLYFVEQMLTNDSWGDQDFRLEAHQYLLEAFAFHLLNICQTPEEVANFKRELDALTAQQEKYRSEFFVPELYSHTTPYRYCLAGKGASMEKWEAPLQRTFENASSATAQVPYELLKVAAAARYHLLTTGDFPATPADFAPLLPDGLPTDPFRTTCTLQMKATSDTLTLYSVGPDGVDNGGKIVFDPEKWRERNTGDVILTLPRKPLYPFQKGGIRAANAADLLRQFPDGLPSDPHAYSTPVHPMSILDSTTTESVRVFSFGPAVGEEPWLQTVLESKDPAIAPPPGASVNRINQRVFIRERKSGFHKPPIWTRPAYDPTQGATSDSGCLYIEIPKP